MKTNIIQIGNSKGIRLPKSILEQCQLTADVELLVEGNVLTVRPIRAPRSGWADAFADMARRKDDVLLDADTAPATDWEKSEWRW